MARPGMVNTNQHERRSFAMRASFRYDEFLRWNPDDFNGIRRLNLPSRLIWLPDIVLYNVNAACDILPS